MGPNDLVRTCPDCRDRQTYISGPNEMLDAFNELFDREADCEQLHMERFQPKLGLGQQGEGEGGPIKFQLSEGETESDCHQPILVAGGESGVELPFGCREWMCHTHVGELRS